ncbi:hypothetical protein LRP88_02883 [Fusarium phalaenopsidis]
MSHLDEIMGLNCWNKTVPIFLLNGPAGRAGYPEMLRSALHNYLYRRWFRPYRTDIEYGQFIAHILHFRDQPAVQDEDSAVDLIISMHGTVCSGLDSKTPKAEPENQQYYITRPLFRAIAIAIQGQDSSRCYDIRPITYMPVLIILTGQDDGLNAPITFDSIPDAEIVTIRGKIAARTNIETAMGSIMALEEREDAAFGPQPDPVASMAASTGNSIHRYRRSTAKELGWGNEILTGPSSQWADMNKYPDWTGLGARYDRILDVVERRSFERHMTLECNCIERDFSNQ